MTRAILPSSTILATFTVEDLDGDLPTIEIRPRMSPAGYVIKGFDAYHRDNNTDIGGDTVLSAIEAALDSADAMGWTGYTITYEGVNALAAETVDAYFDELASEADADIDGLIEIEGANPVWKRIGIDNFAVALRAAFAAKIDA